MLILTRITFQIYFFDNRHHHHPFEGKVYGEEEEKDMIEIGIIVVKMIDDMILTIVMIEGDEVVLIDMMIEIGI